MKKIIIFISFILFLSILFLIYKDFNTSNLNKGYYLAQSYFFIFIFLITIIIIFCNKIIHQYFLITFVSIFASLYIIEFYMFKSGGIKFFTSAEDHWQNERIFHKKEIVKHNALSAFSLTTDEMISFSGISNSKIVFCKESNFFSKYESDRYGFNNPDFVWDNKADLLILGDSFVHGACVDAGYDIPSQLRKIGKLNVVNLGWPNTGPLKQYSSFLEYVEKYPRYIFWVYYENDLDDLNKELNIKLLKKYIDDKDFRQNLTSERKRKKIDKLIMNKHKEYMNYEHKIDTRVKFYNNFIDYLKLYKTRQLLLSQFKYFSKQDADINSNYYNNLLNEYFFIFDRFKESADRNNSEIVFVYLPTSKYHFSNRAKYFQSIKKKLFEKLRKENVGVLDIEAKMDEIFVFPEQLYARNSFDQHFNEKGYKFVAENILEYINKNEKN